MMSRNRGRGDEDPSARGRFVDAPLSSARPSSLLLDQEEEEEEEEEEQPGPASLTSPWSELQTLDLSQNSQYSGFHRQDIDVTSPDHVSSEPDLFHRRLSQVGLFYKAFLYTDTESGHELIETHVAPDAETETDTSSLGSEGSEEDTVLHGASWEGEPGARGGGGGRGGGVGRHQGTDGQGAETQAAGAGREPGSDQRQNQTGVHAEAEAVAVVTSGYSVELDRALRTRDLPDCHADELELSQQFDQPDPNRKWREGVIKSSFNYLLLDPRVTKNLPFRSRSMTSSEVFSTFISAIFYVGKGKRSRPYSHLYEALEYHRGDKTSKKLCSKVQRILEVWRAGGGVVSLLCFQNVIPVEAFTREACMVDAIGLKMLTNQKRGHYYGVVSKWPMERKRDLGVHLLHRAMTIFLAEGERQLRPANSRAGQ